MRFFLFLSCIAVALAKDWAVIVAGSKTYGNYRHQADACHAYHITSKWGIPDERIIMMFYDDIASSSSNPFKGKMFNKPTEAGTPGVDVYEGCKKDYTGAQVTPANFVKVLTGDSSANGPVLKSTSEDNVFINFVDHGGTNLIAFPSGTMSSSMLNNALKQMHSNKMYKKLVFYMEACESGSMFESLLPTDMNIYATTASNAKESSWGTYCPPDDKVNGVELKSCLGDLYSVNWMENCDEVGKKETLADQFAEVKKTTTKSHVMQYGTMSFTSDPIGDFMGDVSNNVTSKKASPRRESVNVRSRDIPLHLAYYNYIRADKSDFATRQSLADALAAEVASRQQVDNLFHTLATNVFSTDKFFQEANPRGECFCCDQVHEAMYSHCGGYTDYSLQYSRVVVNLCEVSTADVIIEELKALC
jgi:legumain